ncbi:hypothetical protein Misp03_75670 [Microbispora sp. NBRC 16548]|nr:hypothetical protein Misp03_75670 [Microbispora sp. NBRC 16548]
MNPWRSQADSRTEINLYQGLYALYTGPSDARPDPIPIRPEADRTTKRRRDDPTRKRNAEPYGTRTCDDAPPPVSCGAGRARRGGLR